MDWKLADAKNKFSEVVKRALTEGPQRITRRDDAVIVVSETEYQRLTGQRPGFRDYLLGSGPSLEGVDLTRDRSPDRDVSL
jgi:antitoxin Phd